MRFWFTNTPRTTFVELQQLKVCLVLNDLFLKSDITSTEKFQAPMSQNYIHYIFWIAACRLQVFQSCLNSRDPWAT